MNSWGAHRSCITMVRVGGCGECVREEGGGVRG